MLLRHGIQFGISIALARLLSPDEFGTIALLLLFTGIASALADGGFSAAIIQRHDISYADETTVFWLNLGMGAVMALALLAASHGIANFFARPILEPLAAVMAANVFLGALGSMHAILLTKRLDFRTQMKIGAIATLLSGGVAVVVAYQGFGVWALATQALLATVVTTGLLWVFNPWRPSKTFRLASAQRLFRFGGYLAMSALLDIFYNRLYSILIGKIYGTRELGLYERADSTMHLPLGMLSSVISRVALPIFSAATNDKVQLRQGARLSVRVIMLINVPMLLGLAAVAEPLVLTLFGPKWLQAVPVLQVLCLGGVFWPLHVINLNILMAQGHSNLFFRLEVIKKLLGLTLLTAGTVHGIIGIAWSQVVFGIAAFGINAHYTKLHLEYGMVAQTKDILPLFSVASLMAGSVYWLGLHWQSDSVTKLIGMVTFGIVLFVLGSWAARLEAVRDMREVLRTNQAP